MLLAAGCARPTVTAPVSKPEPAATEATAGQRETPPPSHEFETPPLTVVEVAPGVFAALQPDARRFADSNAVVLVGKEGLLFVDGPQKLTATDWLRRNMESRTQGRRRGLVTTHWHLDHTLGGAMLRARFEGQGLRVEHWGHGDLGPLVRREATEQHDELRAAIPGALDRWRRAQDSGSQPDGTPLDDDGRRQLHAQLEEMQARAAAIEATSLVVPNEAVPQPTTVHFAGHELQLIPLRAHTDADLVVYLPGPKILITGDVVDALPFGGHGRPRSWMNSLRRLAALDVETVVPGHGELMGPQSIERSLDLWERLLEQGLVAIQRGETPQRRYEAWAATEPFERLRAVWVGDETSGRAFDAFIPQSLERCMADLRGEL